MLLASPAAAGDALWTFFEARCLVPYEHIALPDTRDLIRLDGTDIWEGDRFALVLTVTSCAAVGGAGDDLSALLSGRDEYDLQDDGAWQSTTWREPRIEVVSGPYGYAVVETDLES